jgi:mannose-6-phosphate isomerase-like protein (cupin superfamily)
VSSHRGRGDRTTTSRDARAREFVLDRQTRARILTTAAETDGRHDLTDCEQTAGATTPLHLHTRYQERFWVVSGSLTVWAGQDKLTLRPGDYYAVPMNVPIPCRRVRREPARSRSARLPRSLS